MVLSTSWSRHKSKRNPRFVTAINGCRNGCPLKCSTISASTMTCSAPLGRRQGGGQRFLGHLQDDGRYMKIRMEGGCGGYGRCPWDSGGGAAPDRSMAR